ncbi:hypothetical protein [Ruegeria arenilitoris]|uniref:hypothetical protein n=1 Tax=Ruegeria arenilitoris TaxID=1173585 RepID=UPI0014818D29|nr:hypothetical protein [Ruegeria arenilitoris]
MLVETGDKLPVGTPLARIRAKGDDLAEADKQAPQSPQTETVPKTPGKRMPMAPSKSQVVVPHPETVAASPAARRRARNRNVNLGEIKG